MTNAIELSKRASMLAKAKHDLAQLSSEPPGGDTFAAKAVMILMGSYPQMSLPDPDLYIQQMTTLLAAAPQKSVAAMVDPRIGIITVHAFLPSIAEIHKWLDERQIGTRTQIRQLRGVIETLEDDGPTPPPKEVREKQIAAIPASLRKRTGKETPEWMKPLEQQSEKERKMNERFAKTQRSVPELSMQGLKNLDKMSPGSKD